jgi:hypothetical protein
MSQKNMYNDCLDEDKLIAFMDDQIGPDQYLIPKDIRIRRKSGNVSCYFVSSPWLIASTVLNCILIAVAVIGWVAHWRTPRINDDSCKSLFAAYCRSPSVLRPVSLMFLKLTN